MALEGSYDRPAFFCPAEICRRFETGENVLNLEFHPLANIFPLVQGREFEELKADIAAHGLREPIWLYECMILDGRNRYMACKGADVEPAYREYQGDDALAFVVSLNLKRRHLSESQRGMVAANIANLEDGQKASSANLQSTAVSQTKAAELLNVSTRTVASAAKVKQEGAPELVDAVQQGTGSVSAAADVATLTKPEQVQIVARGEKEILAASKAIRSAKAEERRRKRVAKVQALSKTAEPLTGKVRYPVLLCDPPWRYEHIETESRAIENQYPTMTHDELCALPVADAALDDCVLFLWATSPKLGEAFALLDAWGFNYRTCAVWDKEKIGMGYYFRQQHELLLVAVRGNPMTPAPADRPSSVIRVARGIHSEKPIEVYELIESMYPDFSRLELFARSAREGWNAWGYEAPAA